MHRNINILWHSDNMIINIMYCDSFQIAEIHDVDSLSGIHNPKVVGSNLHVDITFNIGQNIFLLCFSNISDIWHFTICKIWRLKVP